MAVTTATSHWKLGLFVVVSILTMVGAVFWLGARGFHRDSVAVVTYFDESVQGLDVGSPNKFRGVTIGTVSDITLAPDRRNVQVTSEIYVDALTRLGLAVPKRGEQSIDPSLRVQLASAGITGVRFLQTDFFDPHRFPPPPLPFPPPWNYIPSAPSTLKSLEDAAVELTDKLPELIDRAEDALADFHQTLGSVDRLAIGLAANDGSLNRLLIQFRSAAARVEVALNDAKVGATTASLRDTSGTVGQAASSVGTAASSVGTAANNVTDVREELQASLIAFREALDSVRVLADALGRDPSVVLRGPPVENGPPPRNR
jgi:phospholipid/cholesterol/gamma-HCH transport system substrate-binding protein